MTKTQAEQIIKTMDNEITRELKKRNLDYSVDNNYKACQVAYSIMGDYPWQEALDTLSKEV